jgi:hypothetical protein
MLAMIAMIALQSLIAQGGRRDIRCWTSGFKLRASGIREQKLSFHCVRVWRHRQKKSD